MRYEDIGAATLINTDCLDAMAAMPENAIDSIVCDPPYGLGFMGKLWDHGVPGAAYWQAALRVAKPGAYMLAFGGTRTHHRLMVAIEDAGWEIRDVVMWVYGSGFPKSHNGAWGGTALKPAWEPIVLARKPLIGTVEQNFLAHGTGGLNIDACRISTSGEVIHIPQSNPANRQGAVGQNLGITDADLNKFQAAQRASGERTMALGRWPANLIHDGSDEVLTAFPTAAGQLADVKFDGESRKDSNVYSAMKRGHEPSSDSENAGSVGFKMKPGARRLDSGSAARFFYCAKASKADRDEGLDALPDRVLAMSNQAKAELARGNLAISTDGMNTGNIRKNNHPTVKPTALMRYLCKLITPIGGMILDPFMGSGSTGKAAVQEGFRFLGVELDTEHGYFDIACARVRAAMA